MSDYAEELAIKATHATGMHASAGWAHPAIIDAIREALAKAAEVAKSNACDDLCTHNRCATRRYVADAITKLGARRP